MFDGRAPLQWTAMESFAAISVCANAFATSGSASSRVVTKFTSALVKLANRETGTPAPMKSTASRALEAVALKTH